MSSKKKLDVEQCKRLLKMSVTRLKIHRNKKIELSKVMNREIADMLAKNKDEMARIKVMQLIYLDYLIEVLNLVEVYAETIHARAQVLMFSPHCPDELRKEIASIIYASPFIENEEMIKVRALFVQQYGKSFPEHCLQAVDPALVARLKRDQPDSALINYYLSTIAKRHNIDWALPSLETVSSMPTVTTHVTFVTQQPSAPPSVPAPVPTFPATPAAGSPYGVPSSPYGQVQQPTSFPSFPSVPSPTSSQSPSASLFPSHPPSFFPPPPSSSLSSSAGFPPPPSVSAFPSFPASTSSLPPPQASRPPTDDDFMARLSALGSFSAAASPPATSHSTSSLPSPSFPQQPSLTSSPAASPFGPPPTVPSAGPFGPTRPLGPSSPGPFGPASTGHASTPAAPSPYSLTANLDSLFPSAGSASSLFPSAPGNLPPDLGSYGQPQPASHTASLSSSALSPPADLGSYGMPASMADLGSYGLPAAPATTAATAKTPSQASTGGDDLDTLWSQTTALSARSSVMLPTLGQSFLEATGHSVKVGGADSSARSDFNLAAARKVVLDLGSGFSKAGFAGETQPRSVFHSVVGTPFYEGRGGASGPDSSFVGNQAQSQRSLLNLTRPIRGGIVRDWSGFERLFSHAFTAELLVDPSTSPVLVAEAPLPSKADRETLLQLLFEKLNVPAVYLASQPVLALHSSGRRSGVVLDCGHDSTYAVPIYEGKCIHHAIQRMDFAGSHLSLQTLQLLQRAGVSLIPGSETEIAQDVKEKVGYAAFDFSQDIQLAALDPTQINRAYTMPDGQVIQLGSERFSLSEPLFSPMLLQSGATPSTAASGGLQDLVFKAVVNSPTEARRALLSNVVLTGGTCLLPGLSERLEKELNLQAPAGVAVHVVAPPNLQFSAWIGGAMLASTQTTGWLTRQQYLESGPTIVHKAFPLDPSN